MRCPLWLTLAGLSALLLADVAVREKNSPRQYYGAYAKHPRSNYLYRPYYYKPTPTYSGYKRHYVVYFPNRPRHLYFYNPYRKEYWGRCPIKPTCKPLYSKLPVKERKASIEDIDEKAFPEPAKVPPIPESTDGAPLELPPDDLPVANASPGK